MEIEAFYSKMQAEIASQSYVHSNGQCMIWTGPMKHGTEYGVIRYKDPQGWACCRAQIQGGSPYGNPGFGPNKGPRRAPKSSHEPFVAITAFV